MINLILHIIAGLKICSTGRRKKIFSINLKENVHHSFLYVWAFWNQVTGTWNDSPKLSSVDNHKDISSQLCVELNVYGQHPSGIPLTFENHDFFYTLAQGIFIEHAISKLASTFFINNTAFSAYFWHKLSILSLGSPIANLYWQPLAVQKGI